MNGWRTCITHTHTHTMECYSAIIKNEILPFATMWMDLANIMLSEISQTVKDKYSMSSLLCRIQKIKQMNIYNKTDTDA